MSICRHEVLKTSYRRVDVIWDSEILENDVSTMIGRIGVLLAYFRCVDVEKWV